MIKPLKHPTQCVPRLFKPFIRIIGGGVLFISLLITSTFSVLAQNKPLTASQQDFLNAYQAILQGDRKAIAHYKRELKDYPLYPYVLYHDY